MWNYKLLTTYIYILESLFSVSASYLIEQDNNKHQRPKDYYLRLSVQLSTFSYIRF